MTTSAEQQARDALCGWTPLTDLVTDKLSGLKIYPDEIPEGVDLPALTYERTSTSPDYSLDGTLQASKVTVLVTALARSRLLANRIATAATDAMHTAQNRQIEQGSAYIPETKEYGAMVSFEVWEL